METIQRSGVDEAIDLAGGPQALAEKTGESIQTVCNWRERRQVAARRAALVSRITGVDLRRLRPHDWQDYWPDLEASANDESMNPAPEAA